MFICDTLSHPNDVGGHFYRSNTLPTHTAAPNLAMARVVQQCVYPILSPTRDPFQERVVGGCSLLATTTAEVVP